MNRENAEVKDLSKLLELSILPLMAEMIKAMGEHSHRYETYIKEINDKIGGVESSTVKESQNKEEILEEVKSITEISENLIGKSVTQEEALNILVKTISTFGEKLTELIDTNNKLVNHQHLQIDKMEEVILAFEENTARLDTLTLAIEGYGLEENSSQMNHPLHREYIQSNKDDSSDTKIEIPTIKNNTEPIHKVLEKEIERLKNSTRG